MADFVLEAGTTISHFRLEKKLGEGGMGAVFLAEDLTLSRQVAIKFMSRALLAQIGSASARESIEKRFIREARSAAAINHPNLAQIYEANFESDTWYIAMELINGKSLEAYVNPENALSVQMCVNVLRQVVNGLKFAWDNTKIVHRDIKPGNIMVTTNQMVKIVDLGLAKPVASTADEMEDLPDITCAGTPIGTPQYMAPEQATGETDIDFKIDIFALGATMYEMLAGRKCFQERTAALIYMAQMQKKYKPLTEYRPDVPEGLATLIDQMLEPSALDRIESYDAILAALDAIQSGGPAQDLDATMISLDAGDVGSAPTVAEQMLLTGGGRVGSKSSIPTDYYPNDHLIQERYRVIRPIGKSRAGHVYMCTDTQLGVEVAVKTLYPGREFAPGQMDLVRENFQKLLSMSNPHLVQIRDLSRHAETGELYVVMELLRGQNLRQWTHKRVTEMGTLTTEVIRPVMRQIAEAVDSVNKTFGTIHNDLKPESIFLTGDNERVVLLDYGITFMPPPEVSRAEGSRIALDAMPMPNPDYMAPELWQMQPQTLQTDQYSLGVVLYEMLTHKLPFWLRDPSVETAAKEADDKRPLLHIQLEHQYRRVVEDEHKPLPNLTRSQNAALARGLAKTPAGRFPTCVEFVDELCGKPASGGMGKVIAAVAALVLVGAGVVGFIAFGGGDDPVITDPVEGLNTSRVEVPVDPTNTTPVIDSGTDTRVAVVDPTIPVDPVDVTEPPLDETATAAQLAQRLALAEESIKRLTIELAEQRARLAEGDRAPEGVKRVDDVAQQAKAAAAEAATIEAYNAAIKLYRDAIDLALREKAARDRQLAADLAARATAIREQRETLRPFEALDTSVAENLAKYDRAEADAARALKAEKWDEAAANWDAAEASILAVQKLVEETYTPRKGKNFTVPDVGMEFIWIDAMECWVGKYETTNAQFRKFKPTHNSGVTKEEFPLNGDTQPVVLVSYFRAVEYCSWLTTKMRSQKLLPEGFGFRLPDKDEWVYFAACGEDRLYPWGNDLPPKYGNFGNQEMFPDDYNLGEYADPFVVTCPVDKSGANDWGLYGTAGNVWEWSSADRNGQRGVFGGSWTDAVDQALRTVVSSAFADPSVADFDSIGFRVILALPPVKD